ncbi:MAG: VanZ family protein [Gammaproteobacteria bacterium]|nr:VanZ family protein [Gammaproteobacteria bacterium]
MSSIKPMTVTSERDSPSLLLLLAIIGYLFLIAYGSLSPFSGWDGQRFQLARLVAEFWPTYFTFADFVTNFVAYVPLGLLLTLALVYRTSFLRAILYATASAGILSIGLEILQLMLPERIASLFDAFLNISGALCGAIIATVFSRRSFVGQSLRRFYKKHFVFTPASTVGLSALTLWALSIIVPTLPILLYGLYRQTLPEMGLDLAWGELNITQTAIISLQIIALGLLASTLPQRQLISGILFTTIASIAILLNIALKTHAITLTELGGSISGIIGVFLILGFGKRPKLVITTVCLVVAYALKQSQPGPLVTDSLYAFNWIPFKGQTDLRGIINFLEEAWIFAAIAYCAAATWRGRSLWLPSITGVIAIGFLAFSLEWKQQFTAGRYPDITDILVVVGAWLTAWLYLRLGKSSAHSAARNDLTRQTITPRIGRSTLAQIMMIFFVGIGVWYSTPPGPAPAAETPHFGGYPQPADLAPVSLPNFHFEHPRLPAPSADDIKRIKRDNPDFIKSQQEATRQGNLYSQILTAYINPEPETLDKLHHRLMSLKFSDRGHEQVKPLAQAYDWLYPHWNERQQLTLRNKLMQGCEYEIDLLRSEELSPYNVYLYNAPLQALVACTIAVYGDHHESELVMRFTHDLWKHHVLPVWQQVMGKNGGWHEGGEYVGIGIGSAIYQVPNMWRKATGEDLFQTEPGIRGFLDFLVYRIRPDNTHMRLGDAGWFDRDSPDRLALALEYRHAAAYSLANPPQRPTPTSWPWGPLTDNTLYNPKAIEKLPLTKYFDGTGLVIMRSGWKPNSTYITFKAGDNFWSHSHLDQGGFTIYKGGELAIDSGYYGPSYGSDHHMNYTYQTIAHNLITVTDPDDIVPIPNRKQPNRPRIIANDGGQRRIGSGWGIDPAPINLQEWLVKHDTFHTATIEKIQEENNITTIIADLTPAYTNAMSGSGTFSHRTRRVENYKRLFAYDRESDVIVVLDLVTATHPEFRKRWLLHSQDRFTITEQGFTTAIAPENRTGHAGGVLEGVFLLPAQHLVNTVGGDRFEFWVGNQNFDEAGTLIKEMSVRKPLAEPGRWRIELSPAKPQPTDTFLTVLRPNISNTTASEFKAQLLSQTEQQIDFEVTSKNVTKQWQIKMSSNRSLIETIVTSNPPNDVTTAPTQ